MGQGPFAQLPNPKNALLILRLRGESYKISAMRRLPHLAFALLSLLWSVSATAQQLDCQPCNDHFGRVQIGKSIQRFINLKNVGKKPLRIRTKAIKGTSFAFGDFPLPVKLGAGKNIKMPVIFAPVVAGKIAGKITLTSDAKNPKFVINISGVGAPAETPHLTVTPSTLDFGSVTVGSKADLSLTLSASGATVTVTAAQSDSSEFTLPGIRLPLTVPVGQSASVTVRFSPNASGLASATLTISSDADNSPNSVPMTGTAVVAGPHSAALTWDASQDVVIGYNIYRGGTKGGPYAQINGTLEASTDYTDSTVKSGATYFYVVTAVNSEDQESGPSNEVKVVIPSP